MKKKRVLALLGALAVLSSIAVGGTVMAGAEDTPREIVLEKSDSGNPMLGFDANGDILYGGDPSILVDGDTVYCYVGHDASDGEYYSMPDRRCYSTTDMKTWKYESTIMTMQDISWRNDNVSAWASQVAKGSDGKYYFYYCAEGNASVGRGKCIGVAVSDSATGPFEDIGHPLVRNIDTPNGPHSWEDIDPEKWLGVAGNENGTARFWANGNGYTWNSFGTDMAISTTDWHQLTLVGSADGMAAYLDGALWGSASTNSPLVGEDQDIYVGVTNWDAEFKGLVDEVKVYSRALSEAEIYRLYDGETAASELLSTTGVTVSPATLNMLPGRTQELAISLHPVVEAAEPDIAFGHALLKF